MFSMTYNPDHSTVFHFIQHAKFGLSQTINRYDQPKNLLEKLGDLGLWTLEKFPGKIWKLMKEPRWITLALTAIALATVSFAFYPQQTIDLANYAIRSIPLPSLAQVKFGTYLFTVGNILSFSARAYGRFSNEDLMTSWYGGTAVVKDSPSVV